MCCTATTRPNGASAFYGKGDVATLGYGQRLRMNDTFELGLAVSVTRRPYDGVNERIVRTAFDLLYKF